MESVNEKAPATKLIRFPADLHAMGMAVVYFSGESLMDLVGDAARPEIERRFAALPAAVREQALARLGGPSAD